MGQAGGVLILVMLFMAITSTGSAECLAVSSLCTYDIYRTYINPDATGPQILRVSRIIVLIFGLGMGAFAVALQYIGLNLGWVYLFMGVVIGSAVIPMWNLVNTERASATGAVIAAWGGMVLAIIGWLVGAKIHGGSITVATLGADPVMLSGNVIAIVSSGIIHWIHSTFIDRTVFDFATLDDGITLVEQDLSGLGEAEKVSQIVSLIHKIPFFVFHLISNHFSLLLLGPQNARRSIQVDYS
jgi:Na+/proline symporter